MGKPSKIISFSIIEKNWSLNNIQNILFSITDCEIFNLDLGKFTGNKFLIILTGVLVIIVTFYVYLMKNYN